jgi:hypothetical protein
MPAAGESKRDNCAELKPQLTRSTSPQAEAGVEREGAEAEEAEAEEEEEEEEGERRDGGREEAGTNTEEKEEEESIGTDWLSKEEEDCSCIV